MADYTTIRLTGGCLGSDTMEVRCDLSRPESPVQVDYHEGDGWQPTQFQSAEAQGRVSALVAIARGLAAYAVGADESEANKCSWTTV
jgi:hypothetical protein